MDYRYIIGIDLGTTNSAVYSVDLLYETSNPKQIRLFKVPQLTGPGEINRLSVLPSFGYIVGDYDIQEELLRMPWSGDAAYSFFVGAFARDHGSKIPSRLISSAKSWLCHSHVDRKAKILPWGAGTDIPKISPVQAAAAYLNHIKKAWNHARGDDEAMYLENQFIVLTVPASFDEAARELTLEAASLAGISHVTLIEEPLAAFYSFLLRHETDWQQWVNANELILVCDVGGGTTDFSLITLHEVDGSPRFERIAVGDHLILGGDNVDLTLARWVETQVGKTAASLSGDRWKTLCHQCRQAKEIILNDEADVRKITLMGSGSKLIGGTLSAELTRKTVEQLVIDGFFPIVDRSDVQKKPLRKGITEFGLPYETEPAITRHLGWFLEAHRDDVLHALKKDQPFPDCILFNGGSLKPAVIQQRICAAIRKWFGESNEETPRILENPEPDLAVAMGAAYYGLVRMGHGVRVGSGSARSYYLGIETTGGAEGLSEKQAMCLVERGVDEGTQLRLTNREFRVKANMPVEFEVYSSSFRSGDRCGDILTVDDTLTELPGLQTVVQYGNKGVQTSIPVEIEAQFTEMGTLSLWCHSKVSEHRWKLQFQLRNSVETGGVTEQDVFDASVTDAIQEMIQHVFSDSQDSGKRIDGLSRKIAEQVDRPKENWPLGLIRPLADTLLSLIAARTHSMTHEARWLNLTGFCLRPGFGDAYDPNRIKQLWKIYKAGPRFVNQAQVRSEWWILWRRIGAGLTAGQQRQFIQDITPVLFPGKNTKSKISASERMEIWMATANLERLSPADKIKLGRALLAETVQRHARPQHFWAISRIGARELLYGTADRVIPGAEAFDWIERLIAATGSDPVPIIAAVTQMARKTGDRIRDIDPSDVSRLVDWLTSVDAPENRIRMILDVMPIERQDASTMFGEDLPAGLIVEKQN
jgi:molecular chaperone DnaK (HSP70)